MSRKSDTPLKRFSRYGMWKQYIDFNEIEVKMAVLFTILILVQLNLLNCYEKLNLFKEGIQGITLSIAGAFIGVLGFILSGIAIITAMLNSEVCKKIESINGKDSLRIVLCSFEFIAFNVSILVIVLFSVYFSFFSNLNYFNSFWFYALCSFLIYWVIFVIFYLFALIGNCIQMFYIANTYQEVIGVEKKQLNELLNEIRIDFVLSKMIDLKAINEESFVAELIDFLNMQSIDEKEEIIAYLKKHYGVK